MEVSALNQRANWSDSPWLLLCPMALQSIPMKMLLDCSANTAININISVKLEARAVVAAFVNLISL